MAVKIDAGELRRVVTLRQPTNTRNAEGGKEITYTDAVTARAKIEKSNLKSDAFRTGSIAPALLNTDIITMRYATDRAAITKDWLVNYDSADHVVHSIEVIGEREFIKLIVKSLND
jgi:head-tail adaptor